MKVFLASLCAALLVTLVGVPVVVVAGGHWDFWTFIVAFMAGASYQLVTMKLAPASQELQ